MADTVEKDSTHAPKPTRLWYVAQDGGRLSTCRICGARVHRAPKAVAPWTHVTPPAKRGDWHEFTEDVDDASMCVCGIPALTHDSVFPPAKPGT